MVSGMSPPKAMAAAIESSQASTAQAAIALAVVALVCDTRAKRAAVPVVGEFSRAFAPPFPAVRRFGVILVVLGPSSGSALFFAWLALVEHVPVIFVTGTVASVAIFVFVKLPSPTSELRGRSPSETLARGGVIAAASSDGALRVMMTAWSWTPFALGELPAMVLIALHSTLASIAPVPAPLLHPLSHR